MRNNQTIEDSIVAGLNDVWNDLHKQSEPLGPEFREVLEEVRNSYLFGKPELPKFQTDITSGFVHNGFVIAVDGIDGSGKTTVVNILQDILNNGYFSKVLRLNKPTVLPVIKESSIGKVVQRLSTENVPKSKHSNALFMAAAIEDTVQNHVLPIVEQCGNVILDRWISSYLAYQHYAEGIRLAPLIYDAFFKMLYEHKKNDRLIDLYIYCYTDHETSERRIKNDNCRTINHIDTKPREYREELIKGFDDYYQEFDGNKILIDTRKADIDEIRQELTFLFETNVSDHNSI